MSTPLASASGARDFDFLVGTWSVAHRRLKARLAGCTDWESFAGTTTLRPLLDGQANVDDNLIDLPGGSYRAASLRAFDPASGEWAIWWLDARHPHALDTPVKGRFVDGVGSFFADEVIQGQPVRVRFTWSEISATRCRWQQAFSADQGATWETNWDMQFTRQG